MTAYELIGLGSPWYLWYLAQSLPHVGLKCICGKHPWLLYQAATSTTNFSENDFNHVGPVSLSRQVSY